MTLGIDEKQVLITTKLGLSQAFNHVQTGYVYNLQTCYTQRCFDLTCLCNIALLYHYTAPKDHGFEKALAACEASLHALGRHQLDLYLVHWPGVSGWKREDPRNAHLRKDTWAAMEQLFNTGQ